MVKGGHDEWMYKKKGSINHEYVLYMNTDTNQSCQSSRTAGGRIHIYHVGKRWRSQLKVFNPKLQNKEFDCRVTIGMKTFSFIILLPVFIFVNDVNQFVKLCFKDVKTLNYRQINSVQFRANRPESNSFDSQT